MIPSVSKYFSVKFVDKGLHIINNKEILNKINGSSKMQNRISLRNHQSRIYNVQRNYGVNHIGMKMKWNNKRFTSLNVINGKSYTYGVLRNYHYRSDPKLGLGIVSTRIIYILFPILHKNIISFLVLNN